MKNIIRTIVIVFALVFANYAQTAEAFKVTTEDNTKVVYYYVDFSDDSVGTIYSRPFSLSGFHGDSSALSPFRFVHLYSSAGLPRVSVVLQVSPDASNWIDGITLDTGDSVKTLTGADVSVTSTYIYPYYRFKVVGYAGAYQPYNRSDATAKIWLYAYRRNN